MAAMAANILSLPDDVLFQIITNTSHSKKESWALTNYRLVCRRFSGPAIRVILSKVSLKPYNIGSFANALGRNYELARSIRNLTYSEKTTDVDVEFERANLAIILANTTQLQSLRVSFQSRDPWFDFRSVNLVKLKNLCFEHGTTHFLNRTLAMFPSGRKVSIMFSAFDDRFVWPANKCPETLNLHYTTCNSANFAFMHLMQPDFQMSVPNFAALSSLRTLTSTGVEDTIVVQILEAAQESILNVRIIGSARYDRNSSASVAATTMAILRCKKLQSLTLDGIDADDIQRLPNSITNLDILAIFGIKPDLLFGMLSSPTVLPNLKQINLAYDSRSYGDKSKPETLGKKLKAALDTRGVSCAAGFFRRAAG